YSEVLRGLLENRLEEFTVPISDYISNSEWAIIKEENTVKGNVVIVDYFGNVITNIHMEDIAMYFNKFNRISIYHRNKLIISNIVENYNDVNLGDEMCR